MLKLHNLAAKTDTLAKSESGGGTGIQGAAVAESISSDGEDSTAAEETDADSDAATGPRGVTGAVLADNNGGGRLARGGGHGVIDEGTSSSFIATTTAAAAPPGPVRVVVAVTP